MSILSKIYQMGTVFGNTIVNKIPSRHLRRLYYRCMGAKIGKKSLLFRRVELIKPLGLNMGSSSSVGWFSLLDARGGITIGNNVTVAGYCKLVTAKHDINDPFFKSSTAPIVIEDYAWICTNAMILGG